MANITVDLSEKACHYVEAIYRDRLGIVRTCENLMDSCKNDSHDPEVVACLARLKTLRASAVTELEAIYDALSALHLAIDDGNVFSDGWPSNFNRIRRFITQYDDAPINASAVFRGVLSSFGIIYSYDAEAGVVIRYTSRLGD